MRRYRKGQTFRPPSAAESAANADAIEAFRRRPELPQDQPTRGSKILVKTPSGGIAARDGTTIYSATCTRCVESSGAGEKTILETDEPMLVYNLDTTAVSGGIYINTGLTMAGTRCAEMSNVGNASIRFEVLSAGPFLGDLATECDYVVAEVLGVSCQGAGVEVDDEVNVWDPSRCQFNIPIDILIGAHGRATRMVNDTEGIVDCEDEREDEGSCLWEVQTLCCNEEIYGT